MAGKKILMMMTGSIAAYKACQVVSRLVQAGHEVQVVASPSALQFVGAATLEGLSGLPVASDLWEKGRAMDHIHLIRKADLVLVAPATAHFVNRAANGIGDDLLTTLFLAHDFKKPFLLAPAMNTTMYLHPATQESLRKLKSFGVRILETASGVLACGETGFGKLLEPDLIQKEVLEALAQPAAVAEAAPVASSISAKKVLITSGGTREPIDDVRVLTNLSTGRSGAALADQLSELGFDVTLLRAKEAVVPASKDLRQKTYVTHADLKAALSAELSGGEYTHVIHMAAVSDYQVSQVLLDGREASMTKLPSGQELTIKMKPTEKLLPQIKSWAKAPVQVAAFKLTSHADQKTREEAISRLFPGADVVVSNDLSEISENQHPYLLKTSRTESRLNGISELSAWFSNWILAKEAL